MDDALCVGGTAGGFLFGGPFPTTRDELDCLGDFGRLDEHTRGRWSKCGETALGRKRLDVPVLGAIPSTRLELVTELIGC